VKGAREVLGHDSFIMWSVELSVGKVPKKGGNK
jgi:hypothetical protein